MVIKRKFKQTRQSFVYLFVCLFVCLFVFVSFLSVYFVSVCLLDKTGFQKDSSYDGAVNTQGLVCKFLGAKIYFHSFIHSFIPVKSGDSQADCLGVPEDFIICSDVN